MFECQRVQADRFAAIGSGLPLNGDAVVTGNNLFNGNIGAMLVNIPKLGDAKLYGYSYDQLNRIKGMNTYNGLDAATNTFTPSAIGDYKERVGYDANGNIKTYLRNGAAAVNGLSMDNMTYHYYYHSTNGSDPWKTYLPGATPSDLDYYTNRLAHVKDAATSAYTEDIKDQIDENYDYDEIGNLTKDVAEGITNITWTVYGKISTITKSGTTISYVYDASGNRIGKTVTGTNAKKTWYVRDASGNVMAIYENGNNAINSGRLSEIEVDLYGSNRLGLWRANRDVEVTDWALIPTTPAPGTSNGIATGRWTRGNIVYELSNHLGNVLATVSDRKIQVDANSNGEVDYYTADVITANDFYAVVGVAQRYVLSLTNNRNGLVLHMRKKTPVINSCMIE